VAFETPHYAASETDYRAMAGVFPLFYDRTMATPDISAIQFFPYPTIDRFGRYVVPENLGYLVQENPDPRVIIERARAMPVVRDAVASFYFHAFSRSGAAWRVGARGAIGRFSFRPVTAIWRRRPFSRPAGCVDIPSERLVLSLPENTGGCACSTPRDGQRAKDTPRRVSPAP
jgi:hypothetical protein